MRDFASAGDAAAGLDPVAASVLADIQAEGVAVSEPVDVGAYLAAHPDLGGQLERLSRTARQRLGPETALTLEFVRDPETHDEHLTLYARQAAYDLDLIDLLDEILEAHANDAGLGDGWVTLTTDFQPPG